MNTNASIQDYVVVQLPHIEMTKFSNIVKALGFSIVKQSSMDRAMAQADAGLTYEVDSIEDLKKLVG